MSISLLKIINANKTINSINEMDIYNLAHQFATLTNQCYDDDVIDEFKQSGRPNLEFLFGNFLIESGYQNILTFRKKKKATTSYKCPYPAMEEITNAFNSRYSIGDVISHIKYPQIIHTLTGKLHLNGGILYDNNFIIYDYGKWATKLR